MSGVITMIYKWFAQTEKLRRNPGSVTIQSNLFYKNKRKQNKTKNKQKYKNTKMQHQTKKLQKRSICFTRQGKMY